MKKYKVRFTKGNPIIKKSHAGLLHEDTGTPKGEPIPASKIVEAKNSDDPAVRKRAVFAANAAKWHGGGAGTKVVRAKVKA